MKKYSIIPLSLVVFSLALISSCGNNGTSNGKNSEGSEASGEVRIDGSSTVYPISLVMADEYAAENPKSKVNIGVSGTGSGFKKFIRNEIDIAAASRPIKKSEDSSATAAGISYVELPIAFDGLAVVVHPSNTFVDYLTVAELKKIWEPAAKGKIKTWNQVRASWPNTPITLYGAGTGSGTFDYFNEAIVGDKTCRADYNANEDDNVLVRGVQGDKNALGYFGLDYYIENKDQLKLVPIDDQNDANGKGAILPTTETVLDGTYQPLSRPLLIYINVKSLERKEVSDFVGFYLDNAEKLIPESGYVPFNKETYELVRKRYAAKTTGSVFMKLASMVGIKMEDVLKLE